MGMRGPFFTILGMLATTACIAETANADNQANQAEAKVAERARLAGQPVVLKSDTPLLTWQASWPAEVNAIPELEKLIRGPAEKALAEYTKFAREDKANRDKDGISFNPYEYSDSVDVVGDTSRLLSLARHHTEYSGGAHPNHGTDGILWDKAAKARITAAGLLVDGSSLEALYREAFCKGLNEERAVRREGEDAQGDPESPFDQCPKFSEIKVIPTGPAGGGAMTTLVFHADPYVAGPYVEGDYDVDLPVSAAFIAALKPEYRSSFAAR